MDDLFDCVTNSPAAVRRYEASRGGEIITTRIPSQLWSELANLRAVAMDFHGVMTPMSLEDVTGLIREDDTREDLEEIALSQEGAPIAEAVFEEDDMWSEKRVRSDIIVPEAEFMRPLIDDLIGKSVSRRDLENAVRADLIAPRPGLERFVRHFKDVLVVSSGLADLIKPFMRIKLGFYSSKVAATSLRYTRDGLIEGYDEGTVAAGYRTTEALRKAKEGHMNFSELISIGTVHSDTELLSHFGMNALLIPPGSVDPAVLRDVLPKLWLRLTLIVFDDSFDLFNVLLEEAKKKAA